MTTDRDPLELLADEFIQRYRRGERPSLTEFAEQHPALADEIRELFPTILAVEYAKETSESGHGTGSLPSDDAPKRLGDFRIIRELGRGGMGVVYEAEQESLGRVVAVKVLPSALTAHKRRRERFYREARMAARLHHTNIVPVFGVGSQDGHDYFVMQRIHGVGLDALIAALTGKHGGPHRPRTSMDKTDLVALARDLLTRQRHLTRDVTVTSELDATGHTSDEAHSTVERGDDRRQGANVPGMGLATHSPVETRPSSYWIMIARLVAQAAAALAYAHEQGVLHRDVKPGNLLLDENGVLWVTDFGLAKAVEHENLTEAGDVLGTLRYMAPEQFHGSFDERSDQYSLGVTLYEMATLHPAFGQQQRGHLLSAIAASSLTPPRQLAPSLPRDLETIILKATAGEPSRRYARIEQLQADLEDFIADRPIRARRMSFVERTVRWSRRHRALAASMGLAACLLLAVAAVSTVAYFQVRAANEDVRAQRERAESTAQLAVEALDTIFEQFTPIDVHAAGELTTDDEELTLSVSAPPLVSNESAQMLGSLLEFYQRLSEQQAGTHELRRKTAAAQARVGEIYERLGRLDEAREAYVNALEQIAALPAQPGAPAASNRLARAQLHNQIGRTGNLKTNRRTPNRPLARRCRCSWCRDGARPSRQQQLELARTYYLMSLRSLPALQPEPPGRHGPGRGQRREEHPPGRPRGGRERSDRRPPGRHRPPPLGEAIELLEQLKQDDPQDPRAAHLLARCLAARRPPPRLPSVPPGDDHWDRAIEILEELVAEYPQVPQYRVDLAELLSRRHGRRNASERVHRAEAMLSDLVAERPNVPAYSLALAQAKLQVGRLAKRRGEFGLARQPVVEALELQRALMKRFPEITSYVMVTGFYEFELGLVLRDLEQWKQAELAFKSALRTIDSLPESQEGKPDLRDLAGRCHNELSIVFDGQGRHDLAEAARREARASTHLGPAGDPKRGVRVRPRRRVGAPRLHTW